MTIYVERTPSSRLAPISTFSEHHIYIPRVAKHAYLVPIWNPLSLLELEIVCHDDMGNQRLHFVDREKTSRT